MSVPLVSPTVHRHTLPNGLRVCVVPDPNLPLVAVDVSYDVGSRDEAPGTKGFAHLFEHLMFAGSANVAAGELSAVLSSAGGAPNATTDFDLTHYFVTVPVEALEVALWLEADRMGGMLAALDQRALDNEREIVANERRQNMESVPFGLLWQEIFQQLFPADHPYHWVPMGSMQQLREADLSLVRSFFTDHYAPDNAVLTLVGDVTPERGVALAEKYFGGIPAHGSIAPHRATSIEPLAGPTEFISEEFAPIPASVASWRIPAHDDPAWPALRVAATILGEGDASRLHRRLVVETGSAENVMAAVNDLHGDVDGFQLGVWFAGDADPREGDRIRDEIVADLAERGPDATELRRAQATLQRGAYSEASTRGGLAGRVGVSELRWPGRDPLLHDLQLFAAVTAEDVAEAVRTWLAPERSSLVRYEGGDFEDMDGMDDMDEADEFGSTLQNEEAVSA